MNLHVRLILDIKKVGFFLLTLELLGFTRQDKDLITEEDLS